MRLASYRVALPYADLCRRRERACQVRVAVLAPRDHLHDAVRIMQVKVVRAGDSLGARQRSPPCAPDRKNARSYHRVHQDIPGTMMRLPSFLSLGMSWTTITASTSE